MARTQAKVRRGRRQSLDLATEGETLPPPHLPQVPPTAPYKSPLVPNQPLFQPRGRSSVAPRVHRNDCSGRAGSCRLFGPGFFPVNGLK